MKSHKYDVEDAIQWGQAKATLLEHIKFHSENNIDNPIYFVNGHWWCHAKLGTLEKMYPYLNSSSISRWLRELESDGVIESCKPYSKGWNHTKFYRVIGHLDHMESSEINSNSQNEKSISQNENSLNSQNGNSSIYNHVNNYYSVDEHPKNSENRRYIPTEQEVIDYFIANNQSPEKAREAWAYYQESVEAPNQKYWRDSNDKPVKNWKMKMRGIWFEDSPSGETAVVDGGTFNEKFGDND